MVIPLVANTREALMNIPALFVLNGFIIGDGKARKMLSLQPLRLLNLDWHLVRSGGGLEQDSRSLEEAPELA